MQTAEESYQSAGNESKEKRNKFRPWRSLFNVLDKLHLKKQLTRLFIFHPPKLSYDFQLLNSDNSESDPVWEFKPNNSQRLRANRDISIKAFKLYREKHKVKYTTPLIWIQNKKSTSDYIVLYSHGNSSDLGSAYGSGITFAETFDMDVVVYDYTGYGLSPNKPSEKNLYKDIEGVISFIVNFLNYPLNKIILIGFSLGSGPTVEMAARYQSLPFILLFAPLASCLAIVEGNNSQEKDSKSNMFNNLDKMSKVTCDILFVHGLNDRVISHEHSNMLFNRYQEAQCHKDSNAWLLEVENADHNQLVSELLGANQEYKNLLMHYFNTLLTKNQYNSRKPSLKDFLFLDPWKGKSTSADGFKDEKASVDELRDPEDEEGLPGPWLTVSVGSKASLHLASRPSLSMANKATILKPTRPSVSMGTKASKDRKESMDSESNPNMSMGSKQSKGEEEIKKQGYDSKKSSEGFKDRLTILKEETSRLRQVFSELVVNKESVRLRARKAKSEYLEEMEILFS